VASNKINENLPDKDKIIAKMREFGVPLSFSETFEGKNITLHTFFVSRAVKMNTILQFEKDLMLALKTKSIRILAPIAGTEKIGIELPNKVQSFESAENYFSESSDCKFPVGLNVFNNPIYFDFSTSATPHLLIAGATGGGKSVFLNVLIRALLKKNEFDLILVDPKETEFAEFKRESKVLHYSTEITMADSALKFLVDEMRSRFKKLSDLGFKDISELQKSGATMRRIAVIIDEVADLFLDDEFTEVEKNITRLAQKSRAVGIHLILATQRPSVDVITGKLKANFTSRIAFMTATKVDSKVILDQNGAEQLIGNGDLLFMTPTEKEPLRLQSFY
jgi:S-DNA-T family DNA segregation ATPase FtsK/SpoIIIE